MVDWAGCFGHPNDSQLVKSLYQKEKGRKGKNASKSNFDFLPSQSTREG
jgi:hypothetical protein